MNSAVPTPNGLSGTRLGAALATSALPLQFVNGGDYWALANLNVDCGYIRACEIV